MLEKISLAHAAVLLRLDLNMPIDENGQPLDKTRLLRSLTTLRFLAEKADKTIIISHLGRPEGKKIAKLSLRKFTPLLEKNLNQKVTFLDFEKTGELPTKNSIEQYHPTTKIFLLENIRFCAGEQHNHADFIRQLASLADIFVNDAFSVSHRLHASITGITEYLPSYPGFAFEKEIESLKLTCQKQQKPNIAIIGGKKISTKINLLQKLIEKIDTVVVGGAMANNFLKTQGYKIGKSFVEDECLKSAEKIIEQAEKNNKKLILPQDAVVAENIDATITRKAELDDIKDDEMICDIGEKTVQAICQQIDNVKLLIWNGPLGCFENPTFAKASNNIIRHITQRLQNCHNGSFKAIAGGGDTAALINKNIAANVFTHVSTGGGAFLQWLQEGTLPGILALENRRENRKQKCN